MLCEDSYKEETHLSGRERMGDLVEKRKEELRHDLEFKKRREIGNMMGNSNIMLGCD